jgi:hypothetical protein
MALKHIKAVMRDWNRKRLGRRSAAKVQQQSLAAFSGFDLIGVSASASHELKPCLDAIRHHGLVVSSSAVPKTKCINIYGSGFWGSDALTPPLGIFGLYIAEADTAASKSDACAPWLSAARFIWASSMGVVRQLVALGITSSKIYLLPTAQSTRDIPGAAFFQSAAHSQQFFASRFLLAHQMIGFDDLYQKCASDMRTLPDMLCLGVVEYVARLDDFVSEDTGIAYFPGLRHTTGWLGCGLSYKFLFCLAKRDQLNTLTICEDDVLLPPNWQTELANLRTKILPAFHQGEAHVFAGIVTTLPEDAVVLAHEDFGARKLVTLNKTLGAVFNVYSKSAVDYMSQWDPTRHDLVCNTIDKYLMNKVNLRALALVPFFVLHKEDVVSTLWNTNNGDTYNVAFDKTQQRIIHLITCVEKGSS